MARKANTTNTTVTESVATTVIAPPETPKMTRARATRARADVQSAYDEIVEETTQNVPDAKLSFIVQANEDRIRKSVAGQTVDKAVQSLSAIGLELSRGLNQISESVVQKLNELQDLTDAVDLQKNELSRLHKIDVAATALDNMVADYEAKKSDFEATIAAQTLEFETLVAEKKAAWAKEESDHARLVRERNEETEKLRRREVQDYEYTKNQERKLKEDAIQEQMLKVVKQAKERQEALEKDWLVREEALKAREAELVDLRTQVAGFDALMKKEIAKAEAVVSNTLKRDYDTKEKLANKDFETAQKISTQEIASLQATIAKQTQEIANLQSQLLLEKQASQNVVVKALESASGQQALKEVAAFASNQNGNSTKK